MSPGRLPVFNAIESRHATGMTVHDPQQDGLILFTGISNRLGKVRAPRDFVPVRFDGGILQGLEDGGVSFLG